MELFKLHHGVCQAISYHSFLVWVDDFITFLHSGCLLSSITLCMVYLLL